MTSLANINKRIATEINSKVTLFKGEGYHYFEYDDIDAGIFETKSVYVPYTKDLPLATWIMEAEQFSNINS
jgi:hypothetical protein